MTALSTPQLSAAAPQLVPGVRRPVEVRVQSARVAAIIVTWNRGKAVDAVLRALARQNYSLDCLDVVVVDNASSDGTTDTLVKTWHPDRLFTNPTAAADQPEFTRVAPEAGNGNGAWKHPFASLSIVRNRLNHGGCGGFNTGLAFVDQFIDRTESPTDFVWLVDDDVDLPEGALSQLTETARSDESIGLVGSRTVDFDDRKTTIETTIYFDFDNGWMGPSPSPTHPAFERHQRWVSEVGGTRGNLPFTGVRDVDVVSACSLLARWSAVKKVGFWDRRYFIYCDDADWSLRFARAGFRVVCDLDAVVYHTHWLAKLTPARAYYSQRNLLWLTQKVLAGRALRRATLRRLGNLMIDSRKAMTHCRLFHAEIIRRTAHDVMTNRGGRLTDEGPQAVPLLDALDAAGVLSPESTVLVMCSHHESVRWADELRARAAHALIDRDRVAEMPRWVYLIKKGVPDPTANEPGAALRMEFEPNRGSKWRVQREWFGSPPGAVVIFDQHNECPLLRSRVNIHIDRRRPLVAQVERDGLLARLRFMARWAVTAVRCTLYGLRVRPFVGTDRYG